MNNIELIVIIIIIIVIILFIFMFIKDKFKKEGSAINNENNEHFNRPVNHTIIRNATDFLNPEYNDITILNIGRLGFDMLCRNIVNINRDTAAGLFDDDRYQQIINKINELQQIEINGEINCNINELNSINSTINRLNTLQQLGIFMGIHTISFEHVRINRELAIDTLREQIPNVNQMSDNVLVNRIEQYISQQINDYTIIFEDVIFG